MRFEKSANEHFATIKLLDDKLDSRNAADLKKEMIFLVEAEGLRNVIINLKDVSYADSSGLSALLFGNRAMKGVHGLMVVSEANDTVKKLLEISKLNEVLTVLDTEEEAREAVFMHVLQSDIEDEIEEEGEEASSIS